MKVYLKGFVVRIFIIAMAFSMVACDRNPTPAPTVSDTPTIAPPTVAPTPTPPPKVVNVGVCIYKFDDNFMTLYRNELECYLLGLSDDKVTYKCTIVDGRGDQSTQNEQINTFIEENVDVLIINLVQASSAATVIDLVKTADIPTVFINREPYYYDRVMDMWDKIAYVGVDYSQSGTYMGEIIRDLPDHGDINGDGVVSYVMLYGDPESVDYQYRTNYPIKALEDAGVKVERLVEQRGDWEREKGNEITATALVEYGKKIDVVIANNDGMGLGALEAIEAAGRVVGKDIYLVSVDALDEVVELVNEGKYTGTVLNDHIGQSHTAVDVAIKAVNGEKLEKEYMVDYVKVTK